MYGIWKGGERAAAFCRKMVRWNTAEIEASPKAGRDADALEDVFSICFKYVVSSLVSSNYFSGSAFLRWGTSVIAVVSRTIPRRPSSIPVLRARYSTRRAYATSEPPRAMSVRRRYMSALIVLAAPARRSASAQKARHLWKNAASVWKYPDIFPLSARRWNRRFPLRKEKRFA